MDILLDTHALLWNMAGDSQLTSVARNAIADGNNRVFVSVANLWEMSTKAAQGRLVLPGGNLDYLLEYIRTWHMEVLPVTLEHIRAASALPFHHGDPFDRMLVAQANVERMMLVSKDKEIRLYEVDILWK
jgi:PIN domain nuclease of toxin-antitoxin system